VDEHVDFGRDADAALANRAAMLAAEVEKGLIGLGHLVERLMIAILTGGHVLIEGQPGLAKTRAVKRLSEGLDGTFARVQCTPDLMPGDLTGTQVFHPETKSLEFLAGPVFHSLVLVDEINRAPPKVQSALLEAMAEGQVTVGGTTRLLPQMFLVVATQNSIEHEGTYPLPEAQLDRFLMHVMVALPERDAELAILDLIERESAGDARPISEMLSETDVMQLRKAAAGIHLSAALKDYIVRLVMATRDRSVDDGVAELIEHPVSPRGTLALAASARARALLRGRDFAIPEDVQALAIDVLAHRMVPTWRATADGETARGIIARLLEAVEPL
jgi:MoxR-like ATPase